MSILSFTILLKVLVSSAAASNYVFTHANIVRVAEHRIEQTDLIISDGKIAAAKDPQKHYELIDLEGRWIIPGLIDLHVHSVGNKLPSGKFEDLGFKKTAQILLQAGVVAFLDLATDEYEKLFRLRDQQRKKAEAGLDVPWTESDIYAAGAPWGNWNLPTVASAAKKIPIYNMKWRPDVIKLIYDNTGPNSSLDRPIFAEVMKYAHQLNLKTVVHIGGWADAADAIDHGASAVTHFDDDHLIPDSFVAKWAKSKTVSIPTLAVQTDMLLFSQHPEMVTQSALLKKLESQSYINLYKDPNSFSLGARATISWQKKDLQNDATALKKLASAGVTFLAGSDTNNFGTFQGFSLHRELKLFVDGGLSAWDALAAATTRAAEFLGRPSGLGLGDIAELVVLDANPIDSIENTQKILRVIHHGVLVDLPK